MDVKLPKIESEEVGGEQAVGRLAVERDQENAYRKKVPMYRYHSR